MGSVFRRQKGGCYYAKFLGEDGKTARISTKTRVRREAEKLLAKWESEARLRREGLGPGASLGVAELLADYLSYLGDKSEVHRQKTESRIQLILDRNEWQLPTQINQYAVETTVKNLKKASGEPVALRTQAHYLTAIKGWTRWLTRVRKVLAVDPLDAVRKPNFAADRKLIRRFLLPEEWTWLKKGPNALFYETAIQTGYRDAELAQLTPNSLQANALYLPASATKNKQEATQYITEDLAKRLAGQLPFAAPYGRLAELLREDLETAREAYLQKRKKPKPYFLEVADAKGHVLDFHALRHTCGAWLALADVNVKTIQKVMRHSTIVLTLDTYGHLLPGAEEEAVGKLLRFL